MIDRTILLVNLAASIPVPYTAIYAIMADHVEKKPRPQYPILSPYDDSFSVRDDSKADVSERQLKTVGPLRASPRVQPSSGSIINGAMVRTQDFVRDDERTRQTAGSEMAMPWMRTSSGVVLKDLRYWGTLDQDSCSHAMYATGPTLQTTKMVRLQSNASAGREIAILKKLSHENIIKMLGILMLKGSLYPVVEYQECTLQEINTTMVPLTPLALRAIASGVSGIQQSNMSIS